MYDRAKSQLSFQLFNPFNDHRPTSPSGKMCVLLIFVPFIVSLERNLNTVLKKSYFLCLFVCFCSLEELEFCWLLSTQHLAIPDRHAQVYFLSLALKGLNDCEPNNCRLLANRFVATSSGRSYVTVSMFTEALWCESLWNFPPARGCRTSKKKKSECMGKANKMIIIIKTSD